MPRLGDITGKPEEPKRFISAQGFQPYLPEYYEVVNGKRRPIVKKNGKAKHGDPKPIWWTKEHPYIDANQKNINLILTNHDYRKFGEYKFKKEFNELRRSPNKTVFTPRKLSHFLGDIF